MSKKKCHKCNTIKELSEFLTINRRNKKVKKSECKECSKLRLRDWSRKNAEYCNTKCKERANSQKDKAVKLFGSNCNKCKQSFPNCVYDFHHTNPKEKDLNVSKIFTRKWENILPELSKCIMLCSNCHRIIHNGEVVS